MIVVCVCGQKNNVKFPLAEGTTVRCGSCKVGIAETAKAQAERNAKIVLAIVELFQGVNGVEIDDLDMVDELQAIFRTNGMKLEPRDEDEDEENDEDQDEDED
jgi:hypothetical protein